MATAAQIAANRANAQHSTGPRTPEGKAASSMNALKHGADAASVVIPGEDAAEYDRMAAEYRRALGPRDIIERFHLDSIIHADWQRRRLRQIEADLYRALVAEGTTPGKVDVAVLRDSATGKLLLKVWRQIASVERAHSRGLAEIRKLRREAEAAAEEEMLAALDVPVDYKEPILPSVREIRERNEPNFASRSASYRDLGNPALRL